MSWLHQTKAESLHFLENRLTFHWEQPSSFSSWVIFLERITVELTGGSLCSPSTLSWNRKRERKSAADVNYDRNGVAVFYPRAAIATPYISFRYRRPMVQSDFQLSPPRDPKTSHSPTEFIAKISAPSAFFLLATLQQHPNDSAKIPQQ